MPKSNDLKTSFDFPPFLTVGSYNLYTRAVNEALDKLKDAKSATGNEALAIMFVAARDAGLYRNWHSELLPDVMTDDINSAHAFVVVWAAERVHEWIEGQRSTSPKASWRRLTALIEMVRRLLNWSWRGVASGSAASPKQAD